MSCETQNGLPARTGLAAFVLVMVAGTSSGQVETRDWLLPQSGLWSDPLNWSGGDVPDTTLEVARLSPGSLRPLGLGGAAPVAMVDGDITVLRIEGDGQVGVVIPAGRTLATELGIFGENGGRQVVQIGEVGVEGEAELLMNLGRSYIRSATVLMAGPSESTRLTSVDGMYTDEDGVIEGRGTISGIVRNFGVIRALRIDSNPDTLGFGDARVYNLNEIRGDDRTILVFENSVVEQSDDASIFNSRTVTFRDTSIEGGAIRNAGRAVYRVEGSSSFERVLLDETTVTVVGHLELVGPDIVNNGYITAYTDGTIGLGEDFEFRGTGTLATPGERFSLGGEALTITNAPEHTLRLYRAIDASLINEGHLSVQQSSDGNASLTLRGTFEQRAGAETTIGITTTSGALQFNRLVIESGDAVLDGRLSVDVWGNMDEVAGTPLPILRVDQSQGGHSVHGAFDEVELVLSHYSTNISPIPGVEYLTDRVNLTLYCIADVNRDGAVTPADFSAWISAFNEGDELADTNLDGVIDAKDFGAWSTAFDSGCGR